MTKAQDISQYCNKISPGLRQDLFFSFLIRVISSEDWLEQFCNSWNLPDTEKEEWGSFFHEDAPHSITPIHSIWLHYNHIFVQLTLTTVTAEWLVKSRCTAQVHLHFIQIAPRLLLSLHWMSFGFIRDNHKKWYRSSFVLWKRAHVVMTRLLGRKWINPTWEFEYDCWEK